MGQTPRSSLKCKKCVIARNIYSAKYQSSRTHNLKDINKVKGFKKWVKLQGQGHRVRKKNNAFDTH